MTTPIVDFVKKYAESDSSRFHMPGHKGAPLLGCEALDITEIDGADVLYSPEGIIAESEENASSLFDTGHSFYSTEGSSLAIKAMLAIVKKRASHRGRTKVLASRNAHKAFVYACALLDIDPVWLFPSSLSHLCECKISADMLRDALRDTEELPDAVYITSPDYLGNISDIRALASVCREKGMPLLVDNAHGAYLAFCEPSLHPIALGADMCCDSAHKTLPVLTGGAYLHVSKKYHLEPCEARAALSLFASTSPSYLILQSLDLCNAYLAESYRQKLSACIASLDSIKASLSSRGILTVASEPLKLSLTKDRCGYGGYELADILRKNGIEPEFVDRDTVVLMATPSLFDRDFQRLRAALDSLEPKAVLPTEPLSSNLSAKRAMSIREAIFSASERIPTSAAEGRICASPTVSCPPAVPVVMSGEIISANAVDLMLYYGIEEIDVVL